MKDNWIQPFQDKLGDYEFDLPAPAGRKVRWWVPALAGAAAALLLMLLLRTPGAGQQPMLKHALADAGPALTLPMPERPEALRTGHRTRPATSTPATQPAAPAITPAEAETSVSPATPEETTPATPVTPATPATQPIAEAPAAMDDPSQWIPDEEEISRRRVTLSTKLYAGNVAFRESAMESAGYEDLRDAPSYFSNHVGADLDWASNSLLEKAVHAYSVNSTQVKETVCDLPLKTGLSLQLNLTERLSLESGLTYSYHHSKQTLSGSLNGDYYYDYRLHYAGIPLKMGYAFVQTDHLAAYLSLGGEAEMLVGGRILPIDGLTRNATAVKQHPLQFSLVGAAGAEYRFNPWFGLYAEPGVAYHFKPGGDLPNYYREHPWSFDLRVGLRFRLR